MLHQRREIGVELKNSLLIHIVIASSQNLRDLRKNNLALRYGLPMPTSCKNYEKTDSAPLSKECMENVWQSQLNCINN